MHSTSFMKMAKIGYIVSSILFCVFGLILIAFPGISVTVIGTLVGLAMIVFGVFKIIGYFSKDIFQLAFQYDLAFGILLAVLGLIVLIKPNKAISLLCIALGVAILADGLFKVQIAFDSRSFGIRNWWLILLSAVLTGCIGLVLIFRPVTATNVVMVMIGIALFLDGIMSLITVLFTVKIVKCTEDVIDVEGKEV